MSEQERDRLAKSGEETEGAEVEAQMKAAPVRAQVRAQVRAADANAEDGDGDDVEAHRLA
jgi:hypothetical protein